MSNLTGRSRCLIQAGNYRLKRADWTDRGNRDDKHMDEERWKTIFKKAELGWVLIPLGVTVPGVGDEGKQEGWGKARESRSPYAVWCLCSALSHALSFQALHRLRETCWSQIAFILLVHLARHSVSLSLSIYASHYSALQVKWGDSGIEWVVVWRWSDCVAVCICICVDFSKLHDLSSQSKVCLVGISICCSLCGYGFQHLLLAFFSLFNSSHVCIDCCLNVKSSPEATSKSGCSSVVVVVLTAFPLLHRFVSTVQGHVSPTSVSFLDHSAETCHGLKVHVV